MLLLLKSRFLKFKKSDRKVGVLTSRRVLGKEWKHMDVNEVNCIKDLLSTARLLVTVCHLADCHWNPNASQISLSRDHLLCELMRRKD